MPKPPVNRRWCRHPNAIANYIEDMQDIMSMVQNSFTTSTEEQKKTLEMLCRVRSDLVAIYIYNEEGSLTDFYTGGRSMKQNSLKDLSYISREYYNPRTLYLSEPHVESMLQDYYPWVVSVLQEITVNSGEKVRVVIDIRFPKFPTMWIMWESDNTAIVLLWMPTGKSSIILNSSCYIPG